MKFYLFFVPKVLGLVFLSQLGWTLNLELNQPLQQGALITGHTDATSLTVLGRKLAVDESGRFVFGLGRDASPNLKITLVDAQGGTESRVFSVYQRSYETQSIEGVASKYVSPEPSALERIRTDTAMVKAARAKNDAQRYDYLSEFIWPAKGVITGVYGSQRIYNGVPKRPHYGIDIAAPAGTDVVAPAAGRVRLSHPDMYYSGGTLILDHGQGVSSTFIHLSKLSVVVGDEVEQGQVIGQVGSTGRSTGPHLDWRINWFEHRLDPAFLVPKMEQTE